MYKSKRKRKRIEHVITSNHNSIIIDGKYSSAPERKQATKKYWHEIRQGVLERIFFLAI